MRNVTSFRPYATATGLLLVLLVVGLWASGMLVDEAQAQAKPEVSGTANDTPFLTIPPNHARLPSIILPNEFPPSWPVSSAVFILWPLSLFAYSLVSRAPPRPQCPPCAPSA
jgi:hypothetical protein